MFSSRKEDANKDDNDDDGRCDIHLSESFDRTHRCLGSMRNQRVPRTPLIVQAVTLPVNPNMANWSDQCPTATVYGQARMMKTAICSLVTESSGQ